MADIAPLNQVEPDREYHQEKRTWGATVAIALAFLVVASRLFAPEYIDNETIYAIGPIRVLQPEFLAGHPFSPRINPFFAVFDILASPVYLLLGPLAATLVLRAAIWVFQLWALHRLLRALGMAPWTLVALVTLWVGTEQTLVAGEWVIGCASAKPIAYGLLFLGLERLLAGRFAQAGLSAGLATSFHVLVGGWGALAMGVAALTAASEQPRIGRSLRYALAAGLAGLPGLLPALASIASGTAMAPADAAESARIYVQVATPFHLDPAFFLSGPERIKVALYFVVTVGLLAVGLSRAASRVIVPFLLVLAAAFAFGLVARRLEWFGILRYYPFRVADGSYPLFFWIGVTLLLERLVRWKPRPVPVVGFAALAIVFQASVKTVNDILEGGDDRGSAVSLWSNLKRGEPRISAFWLREQTAAWGAFAAGRQVDDFGRMENWIRLNTPTTAVFVIPPWQYSFPLRAARIEFMTFKTNTFSRMQEWLARWEALNGKPLTRVGWRIVEELRANYGLLSVEQVARLRIRFGGDFMVTATSYGNALPLVHQEGRWFLYDLRVLPR